MKNKKILILALIILILVGGYFLFGYINKNNSDLPINSGNLSGDIQSENDELSLNQKINLNELVSGVINETNMVSADSLFNLREYSNLTKRVYLVDNGNEYTEVWLLKEQTKGDAVAIFRLFDERISDLKANSSLNKKLEEVFSDSKNIIMKQEANIAIMIVSNKAEKIEKAIDEKIAKVEGNNSLTDIKAEAKVSEIETTKESVKISIKVEGNDIESVKVFSSYGLSVAESSEGIEATKNAQTGEYELEIKFADINGQDGYYAFDVIVTDNKGNEIYTNVANVKYAESGIVSALAWKNDKGNIEITVDALEAGEVLVSTNNTQPAMNSAEWTKYRAGENYELSIPESQNIYVWYKSADSISLYSNGGISLLAADVASLKETIGGVSNTVNYPSLQAAINAATNESSLTPGTYSEIKMLSDDSLSTAITVSNKRIRLDLYSHTISSAVSNELITVNSGAFEIIDTSESKSGKIIATGSNATPLSFGVETVIKDIDIIIPNSSGTSNAVKTSKTITLENVNIEISGAGGAYGVYSTGGSINMTSGGIKITSTSGMGVGLYYAETINISDARIEINASSSSVGTWNLSTTTGSSTMNNVVLISESTSSNVYGTYNASTQSGCTMSITGGEISVKSGGSFSFGVYHTASARGSMIINGLTIYSSMLGDQGYPYGYYCEGYTVAGISNIKVYVKDVPTEAYGIYTKGSVNISNANVEVSSTAGKTAAAFVVPATSTGIMNLYSGNYISQSTGLSMGVYTVAPSVTINIGRSDGNVSITNPVIQGDSYAIYSHQSQGIFNYYDGVLRTKSSTLYNMPLGENEDGYTITTGNKTINGVNYLEATLAIPNYQDSDGRYYTTLNDAFTNTSTGKTITVLESVDETITAVVKDGKDLVLDLNGKTINYEQCNYNFMIAIYLNGGNLEIKDSASDAGTIKVTSSDKAIHAIRIDSGEFILTSGNINVIGDGVTTYGIYTLQEVNVNGGNINVTGNSSFTYGIYALQEVNVNDGNIDVTGNSSVTYGIYSNQEVNVNDGNINVQETSGSSVNAYGIYADQAINVNGRDINITVHGTGSLIAGIYVYNTATNKSTVDGANINVTSTSNTDVRGLSIHSTSEIEVKNTTINVTSSTGPTYAISANALKVSDCNLTSTSTSGVATGIYSQIATTGTFDITSGTIKAMTTNGIAYGLQIAGATATINIGSKDNAVDTEKPSITGDTYAVFNKVDNSGFNFYDGILKSKADVFNGTVLDKETGHTVVKGKDNDYNTAILALAYYSVDGNYFRTLKEAYDSITGESGTIIVEKSNEDSSVFIVEEDKDIVINMNGNTITKTVAGIVNNGSLIIGGPGEITTSDTTSNILNLIENTRMIEISDVDLTIDFNYSGTTSRFASVIYSSEGSVMIEGGTLLSKGTGSANLYGVRTLVLENTMLELNNTNILSTGEVNGIPIEVQDESDVFVYGSTTIKGDNDAAVFINTIEGSVYMAIEGDSTVEGNSYAIQTSGNGNASIDISSGTIKANNLDAISTNEDFSINLALDGGEIISGTANNANGIKISGQADVTISNATKITGTNNAINFGVSSTGQLTINGGEIKATKNIDDPDAICLSEGSEVDVEINGGIITSGLGGNGDGIQNYGTGDITVTGGTITGYQYGIGNKYTGTVIITGGTIIGQTKDAIHTYDTTSGNITIGIQGNPTNIISPYIAGNTAGINLQGTTNILVVHCGTVSGSQKGISIEAISDITVNGGKVSGNYGIHKANKNVNSDIEIKNTTITGTIRAIDTQSGTGSIIIENSNITATGTDDESDAIVLDGSSINLTMQSGTIKSGSGINADGIQNGGSGNIVINDGTVTGYQYGINSRNAGNVTIIEGTITGEHESGIYDNSSGNLVIGYDDVFVSTSVPTIQGGKYGIYSTVGFEFYDGILKGTDDAFDATVLKKANGYGVQYGEENDYITAILSGANYADNYNNYYTSLADAFKSAPNGSIIRPMNNIEEREPITAVVPADRQYTIDLDGNKITVKKTGITSTWSLIENLGKLELTDSQDSGVIDVTIEKATSATGDIGAMLVKAESETDITNGTYILRANDTSWNSVVAVSNNVTVNLTKGTINAISTGTSNANGAHIDYGTINVYGGMTVKANSTGTGAAYGIQSNGSNKAIINLYDGLIEADSSALVLQNTSDTSNSNQSSINVLGYAELNGGEYGIYNTYGVGGITINDGKITGGTNAIYQTANAPITITNGTITSTKTDAGIKLTDGTLSVINGSVTGAKQGIYENTTGLVEIKGGTITGNGASALGTVNGNVTVSGGTLKGALHGIGIEGGTLTVTGGTITGDTHGIGANATNDITFIIRNGTITGTSGNGIDAINGSVIIGTPSGGVSTQDPEINGNQFGINAKDGFEFYDGILKGKTAGFSGDTTKIEDGYGVKYGEEDSYKTATLSQGNYIDDDDNYYVTLKEAFDKAKNNATITVLQNVDEVETATVKSNKSYTLDLNGKTISVNKEEAASTWYFIQNEGTLNIKDDTERGKIEATISKKSDASARVGGVLIGAFGNVNITGGTYSLTSNTMDWNSAILINKNAVGTINKGSIGVTTGNVYGSGISVVYGTVNVYDGTTIEAQTSYTSAAGIECQGGNIAVVNIYGGTINSNKHAIRFYNSTGNTNNNLTLNILGNAQIHGDVYGINNTFGTSGITIKNGTITGGTYGIYQTANNKIEISNGTITGGTDGINQTGTEEIIISGGTIEGTANNGITNAGDITVSEGTIKGAKDAINQVSGAAGDILITGGKLIGGNYGLANHSTTNKVIIGSEDANVSIKEPMIQGDIMGMTTSSGFEFYDGIFKGVDKAFNGDVTAVEDGYNIKNGTETSSSTTYNTAYLLKEITSEDVTISPTEFIYTGEEKKPTVTVTWKGTTLVEGKDYTVKYENNTDVGVETAKVTVTGLGDYIGVVEKTFSIINAVMTGNVIIIGENIYGKTLTADISGITPTDCDEYIYQWWSSDDPNATSGNDIPGATNQEYTIGNGLIGKYIGVTVTVRKANFATGTFTDITDASNNGTAIVSRIELIKPTLTGTYIYNGTNQTASIANSDEKTMNITGNTMINAGTQNITISLQDPANYKWSDGTTDNIVIEWTIEKKKVSTPWGAETSFEFNGSAQAPKVTTPIYEVQNERIDLVVDGAQTNIGTGYKAIARIESVTGGQGLADNYELLDTEKEFEITAARIKGSVTILGTNTYGQTLTVDVSNIIPDASGCILLYEWWSADDENGTNQTPIIGATSSNSYTIGTGLADKYIGVTVIASKANYEPAAFVDITDDTNNTTARVSRLDIFPTITMEDYIYGDIKNEPDITGNTGNGEVTYYYNSVDSTTAGKEWSTVTDSRSLLPGRYYMYAKVAQTPNYKGATTATVAFVIRIDGDPILMERETGTPYYMIGAKREGKTQYTADLVKTITIVTDCDVPSNAIDSWDASYYQNRTVLAWIVRNSKDTTKYDLYIGGEEGVFAPENCSGLFRSYPNCTEINYLSNLYTMYAQDMSNMFSDLSSLTGFDASKIYSVDNVTNYDNMFRNCTNLRSILFGDKFIDFIGNNMFEGDTNLEAIIVLDNIGEILTPGELGLPDETIIYVQLEQAYEEAWKNFIPADRIEPIIKAIAPNPFNLKVGLIYIDPGYTVAGFTTNESENYTQYGFYVDIVGMPIDVNKLGEQYIHYRLMRQEVK